MERRAARRSPKTARTTRLPQQLRSSAIIYYISRGSICASATSLRFSPSNCSILSLSYDIDDTCLRGLCPGLLRLWGFVLLYPRVSPAQNVPASCCMLCYSIYILFATRSSHHPVRSEARSATCCPKRERHKGVIQTDMEHVAHEGVFIMFIRVLYIS